MRTLKNTLLFICFLIFSNSINAQNETKQPWQYMGKVVGVTEIEVYRDRNEQCLHYKNATVFLYSSFDGNDMSYKIYVPTIGKSYVVHKNNNYNGSQIEWSRNGKRIVSMPSLDNMYTHSAGPYYFNVAEVRP